MTSPVPNGLRLVMIAALASGGCTEKQPNAATPKSQADASKERPMRRTRDRFRMDFRDGNDPAKAPGAVLLDPADNPAMTYDKSKNIVISKATGEWMKFTLGSREDRLFHAIIMNNPHSPIVIDGYFEIFRDAANVTTTKYNITHINASTVQGQRPIAYPINTIAEFLKKYPGYYDELAHGGHVIVIDNHKSRGLA